jgi:hypothetical protein
MDIGNARDTVFKSLHNGSHGDGQPGQYDRQLLREGKAKDVVSRRLHSADVSTEKPVLEVFYTSGLEIIFT